jgi:UDP-N-acetylglucosamine 1-carboxyvinyltransferase
MPLTGSLRVNGSKNAALPQMATALLTDEPVVITGVPQLADIRSMGRVLKELGCEVGFARANDNDDPDKRGLGQSITLRTTDESARHARYDIVRTMRASVCVLGPLLARRGEARVAMPGGCAIGERPIDLHLRGLRALGAELSMDSGDIVLTAPKDSAGKRRLRGASIFLGGPFGSTVLGTANVMSAATLATGRTIIESAACEPEIVDLAALLNAMGARITGAGSPRLTIEGVQSLCGVTHEVMPDRIEAGTLIMAAAITGGKLRLTNCPLDSMAAVLDRLHEMGVAVTPIGPREDPLRAECEVSAPERLRPVMVTTQPHPGFPTDLQAQTLALLTLADGHSVVTEKIFPERFLHIAELTRMGARVFRQGPTAIVSGVDHLVGAPVMASDLRASASLVLAGLAAQGETTILRVYHLDRGYERLELALNAVGARIERIKDHDLNIDADAATAQSLLAAGSPAG